MARIGFLGAGAMGSRMANRLIDAGHDVTVWNRHPARARPLEEVGASIAATPRKAAMGAEAVFSMVRDDAASQSVRLDDEIDALAALDPGAVGIECSTLSFGHVGFLAAAFRDAGRLFVDAPVVGSRPQAEAGQLIFLAGGGTDSLSRIAPFFEKMGSTVHRLGDNGAGAAVKLMVNGLFGIQLAFAAEILGFARKVRIDLDKAIEAIAATPVCSPAVKVAAPDMLAVNFAQAFPIDLVERDFGLIDTGAAAVKASVPVCNTVRMVFWRAKTAGLGNDHITGIIKQYL